MKYLTQFGKFVNITSFSEVNLSREHCGMKKVNYESSDAIPDREDINSWDGVSELNQGNLNNGK